MDKNKTALASFNRKEIKKGVIEEGAIKKEDDLITVLQEAVADAKGEKIKTKYCVVSLPETEAYIRVLKLPSLEAKEMSEAIKWEIEANIPMALDEVYFDWQIIKDDQGKNSDVLVGALPKTLVDPYLQVIKKAGFSPLAFEIESLAIARAVIKSAWSQPVMIIDLGAKRTSLILFAGLSVWFTCSLPVSNNSLIEEIADSLKIGLKEARNLKFEYGLEKIKEGKQVYEALEPKLLELAGEIKKYLNYGQDDLLPKYFSGIGKILICGGGANLKGLDQFFSRHLKINVELGNPWINILDLKSGASELPALPFAESLSFATALGLALRGVNTQ
jgi:type IV pilus assembly protein PilM